MFENMIANLTEILPPPESPIDTDERILVRNQNVLRVEFPEDFVGSPGNLMGSLLGQEVEFAAVE
jgi:hypothetical protein